MPEKEKQMQQPRNILEAINLNVYNISQDLHMAMDEINAMHREIAEIRTIFNSPAPEPNTPGDDVAVEE